jgi:hypothetical protein
MAEGNSGRSGGIGFLGVLTIVFIVLQLTGKIAWSWFWVLSPILLPIIIGGSIALLVFSIVAIKNKLADKRRKKRLLDIKNKASK